MGHRSDGYDGRTGATGHNGHTNAAFHHDQCQDRTLDVGVAEKLGGAVEKVEGVVEKVEKHMGVDKVLSEAEKKERREIMKNILFICTAFLFLFTSYNSMAALQSSINKLDGTTSLTVLYAAFIFSCCFLPSWAIKVLKEKRTIAASMLCYSTYIAAQFYPAMYTLVPTAVILGLAAAPLWSAKCTYLTKAGRRVAEIDGVRSEVVLSRFFGIFFMFLQTTQVWGNIISSTVLSMGVADVNKTDEDLLSCGVNFCPLEAAESADAAGDGRGDRPPLYQIYIMATTYLCCSLVAVGVVALFVDDPPQPKEDKEDTQERSTAQLATATFTHLRHPYQLLIIPLTIWSGLEQAFFGADFTAAYVSCGPGVHMVGLVVIVMGVSDAVCSIGLAHLVKVVGRVPVFTFAFVTNAAVMVVLVYWTPRPADLPVFFVVAALWGAADAVWQTQVNTMYGVIFPGATDAAFSNYRLWECTGFIVAYGCSTSLCVGPKLVVLAVFLVAGMTGYYVIEVVERRGGLRKGKDGRVLTVDQLLATWVS